MTDPKPLSEMLDEFFDRVSPEPNTGCWLWVGFEAGGYGRFGKNHKAHRWIYEYENGAIPMGLQIDHMCEQTLCVNPRHLRAVTARENVRAFYNRAHPELCRNGHAYAPENIIYRTDGTMTCKTCVNASRKLWRDRRKAAGLKWYYRSKRGK